MRRILIIDDEKDFCQLVKQHLRLAGKYKAIIAKGGNMGAWFANCRWHKPDLILLDIMMPGMDGFELLKMLKDDKATSHIAVIMVTARTDEEAKARAKSLHCDGYIVKPISIKDLVSEIEKALSKENSGKERLSEADKQ